MELLATIVVLAILSGIVRGLYEGVRDRVDSDGVAILLTGFFFVLLPVAVLAYFLSGPSEAFAAPIILIAFLLAFFGIVVAPLLVGAWLNEFLEYRLPSAAAFIIAAFGGIGTFALAIYLVATVLGRY